MRRNDFMDLQAEGVRVFGDLDYRGKCPSEDQEQVTLFNRLRNSFPETWGRLAVHPRNEGLKIGAHIAAVARYRAEGMTPGSADIIIPARMAFVCEMKRRDPTLGKWQDGQREYLIAAAQAGAFACVTLGCDAAWNAVAKWIDVMAREDQEYLRP